MTERVADKNELLLEKFALAIRFHKLQEAKRNLTGADVSNAPHMFTPPPSVRSALAFMIQNDGHLYQGDDTSLQLVPDLKEKCESVRETAYRYRSKASSPLETIRAGIDCAAACAASEYDEYESHFRKIEESGFSENQAHELVGTCVSLVESLDSRMRENGSVFIDPRRDSVGTILSSDEFVAAVNQFRHDKAMLDIQIGNREDSARKRPFVEEDGVTPAPRRRRRVEKEWPTVNIFEDLGPPAKTPETPFNEDEVVAAALRGQAARAVGRELRGRSRITETPAAGNNAVTGQRALARSLRNTASLVETGYDITATRQNVRPSRVRPRSRERDPRGL
jgi:hypothetical protein